MASVRKILVNLLVLLPLIMAVPIVEDNIGNSSQPVESREQLMVQYRLPNNTIPRLYKIFLAPNMTKQHLEWKGNSSIDFQVITPTRVITLHAYNNIVIHDNVTELIDNNGKSYRPIYQTRDDKTEFFEIEFDHYLPIGNYSIKLGYEGTKDFAWHGLIGFYLADHPTPAAATHFEATTARRAFPCWDEPGLKARFQLSIKHPARYTAISNMPEIENLETADGEILTRFDTTPIMSTYLLTFLIAEYDSVKNDYGNITVWANKTYLPNLNFVLNTTEKVVEVMEKYTGLSHGVPRVGSVVVPLYSAAATEHWGLVSYSLMALYAEHTVTPSSVSYQRNLLIAHELSHFWFGNRVSPRWWNDLWLNEAFASYFKSYIMDMISEDFHSVEWFAIQNKMRTFPLEHREDNIPITWTPVTNSEIRKLFSWEPYQKGAAMVHMVRNILTDPVFQAGVQKYLTKHSYEAVETKDLSAALQEAYNEHFNVSASFNVQEFFDVWLTQTGYPIVNVTRNNTTGSIEVTQVNALDTENRNKRWRVPLNYATKTNPNFSSTTPTNWLSENEDSVIIDGIDKDDWIIFNLQASGYYRVNYDDENWKRIINHLNSDNYKDIHVVNRAQIINDLSYYKQREPARYTKLFWQLSKYLSREDEYLPWMVVQVDIRNVQMQLTSPEDRDEFHNYFLPLMNKLIENVGYETLEGDDHLAKLSKDDLVNWACLSGHVGCSEFAAQRLLRLVNSPNDTIHPDTQSGIFCAGFRRLNNTSGLQVANWAIANDMDALWQAIGCTENHEIHSSFLFALLHEDTPNQFKLVTGFAKILSSSEENYDFAADYFVKNFHTIENATNEEYWKSTTLALFQRIAEQVTTKAQLENLKKIVQMEGVKSFETITPAKYVRMAEKQIADTSSHEFMKMFRTIAENEHPTDNVKLAEGIATHP